VVHNSHRPLDISVSLADFYSARCPVVLIEPTLTETDHQYGQYKRTNRLIYFGLNITWWHLFLGLICNIHELNDDVTSQRASRCGQIWWINCKSNQIKSTVDLVSLLQLERWRITLSSLVRSLELATVGRLGQECCIKITQHFYIWFRGRACQTKFSTYFFVRRENLSHGYVLYDILNAYVALFEDSWQF